MIRPITCLAVLLACGSGLYLYQSKHRVKLLDDQIARTVKTTDALREQTRMLSAEWTLLNDPERLRQLANQFLTLQTVSPNQFTSLADLDSHLPAPVPAGAGAATGGPVVSGAVPVASDATSGRSRTGADEGKPADAKLAEASPAVSPAAASSKDTAAAAASPREAPTSAGAASQSPRMAVTAPADAQHPLERKPPVPHAAPAPPRLAVNQQRPPAQRPPDLRNPDQQGTDQQGTDPRSNAQRLAEARQSVPAPRTPAPLPQGGGSLLGMAHGMASPPAPVPLPRPMPVSMPQWSYSNGG